MGLLTVISNLYTPLKLQSCRSLCKRALTLNTLSIASEILCNLDRLVPNARRIKERGSANRSLRHLLFSSLFPNLLCLDISINSYIQYSGAQQNLSSTSLWARLGRGSDRRLERRREGWEMMRRSIGPWAVTPLARFHIHLHPSSLRPSETDTTPPFSGRPGRFCRRGCFGPAIIRLSVGSMTSCGQRSVVAPAPIAHWPQDPQTADRLTGMAWPLIWSTMPRRPAKVGK